MTKQLYSDKINDARFIELKIPVHMPTVENWSDYEVVAGQVQQNGVYYNYVKLKMTADTLYFICLPNNAKTQLVNAKISTQKEAGDIPLNKKGDSAAKKVNSLKEYNLQAFNYQYTVIGTFIKPNYKFETSRLVNPYTDSPGKPPNFIS